MANLFDPMAYYSGQPIQQPMPTAMPTAKKKKGFMAGLENILLQPDAEWNPSDDTKRNMIKRGLLDAGLRMLATPTGYGNSPVMGIAGGLLGGAQSVTANAENTRNRDLGVGRYGVRETDYQRAIQAIQDPNTPEQTKEAARIFLRMNPPAKAETWNTNVTPSGAVVQGSSKGRFNVTDSSGQTTQFPNQPTVNTNSPVIKEGENPMQSGYARINQGAEVLKANGVPPDKINVWIDSEFAKLEDSLKGGVYQLTPSQSPVQNTQPARLPDLTKPDNINAYQSETLRLAQESAKRAEEAAKRSADKDAEASALKKKAIDDRKAGAQASSSLLVKNIEDLFNHPGFSQLGTTYGNMTNRAIPDGVVTDYRGALARLDTIKGQLALSAMSELKALSSTGASGFGSLTAPELDLLKNSLQTLSTSQSNADLIKSMKQIVALKSKMTNAPNQAPTAPAGGKKTTHSSLWGDN